MRRSQWPRSLRRGSATARLLRSWVRIPPGAWMSVCCECCVLSGRGLCDELITRPEESYRLWCRCVWPRNLVNEEAVAHWGLLWQNKQASKQISVRYKSQSSLCSFLQSPVTPPSLSPRYLPQHPILGTPYIYVTSLESPSCQTHINQAKLHFCIF